MALRDEKFWPTSPKSALQTAPLDAPRGANKQEAKADRGKLRLTLVPPRANIAMAHVREYGTNKYKDPENWRRVEAERYRDALYRHWIAYLMGETHDKESGLPHMWHVLTNAAFLVDLEWEEVDDFGYSFGAAAAEGAGANRAEDAERE